MLMKLSKKLVSILMVAILAVGIFAGCQNDPTTTQPSEDTELAPWVDYVSQVKLDMNTASAKLEVTVHLYIDGDTTHVNVPKDLSPDGVFKIRYIAVNTPESTGQIEPYGKKASNFTKEKLSNAESIIIESNTDHWEYDSSGSRVMGWVWYKPKGETEYRNLNIELVQEGLSQACGSTTDLYGSYSMAAYNQAKNYKLNALGNEKDPDFYDGEAILVDLKTLRTNIELYSNKIVVFTGTIVRNNSQTVYVEQYDEETDMHYGISVYYGFQSGAIDNVLKVGNLVRFVGSVQYYEAGGTWQVADIHYSAFSKDDPDNIQLVESGHEAANAVIDAEKFTSGKVTLDVMKELGGEKSEQKEFDYAELILSTSVKMENLTIKDIYTTSNGGSNDGAMTFTCEVDGKTVTVRTAVLRKEDKTLYTAADFLGKTVDVTGIVDYYNGEYQIKVFSANNITVHD